MKKFLIGIILLVLLSAQAWAITGDSLGVLIRKAKHDIKTDIATDVPDSVWEDWSNDAYQLCLARFAYDKWAYIDVVPYAFSTAFAYATPTDFYKEIGLTVVSNAKRTKRNIQVVKRGQEFALGVGEGSGEIHLAVVTQDSIQFIPNPSQYDTVLIQYWAVDSRVLTSDSVMYLHKHYTPIMVNYVIYRYYFSMANFEASILAKQIFEADLNVEIAKRRDAKFDYYISEEMFRK